MIPFTLGELVDFLEQEDLLISFSGNADLKIYGFSNGGKWGSVGWVKKGRKIDGNLKVAVLICPPDTELTGDETFALIRVTNPRLAFIKAANYFCEIRRTTVIAETAIISCDSVIGENGFIGDYAIIKSAELGDNCIIHSGVKIGDDGFGYERDKEGVPLNFPHFGSVIIGNNVEVKSNSCINRGALSATVIGDNVKIGSLCHIAHNVIIGKNTMVAGGSIVGGSVKIGEGCFIGMRAVIKNGVKIGDNAVIGMGAVVVKNVRDNTTVIGNPAKEIERK